MHHFIIHGRFIDIGTIFTDRMPSSTRIPYLCLSLFGAGTITTISVTTMTVVTKDAGSAPGLIGRPPDMVMTLFTEIITSNVCAKIDALTTTRTDPLITAGKIENNVIGEEMRRPEDTILIKRLYQTAAESTKASAMRGRIETEGGRNILPPGRLSVGGNYDPLPGKRDVIRAAARGLTAPPRHR